MTREEFEKVVEEALVAFPSQFSKRLENIEVVIEDAPKGSGGKKVLLLGLYQGVPLTKRGHYYAGVLPDKITLYQKNIEEICRGKKEMVEEIKRTLLHELGHYFGISDKKMRGLGY